MVDDRTARKRGRTYVYLLLIVPFIATLWMPFYAKNDPKLAGIPFFYWYMFLWVILSAGLTGLVYLLTE